jgi:hypothetical protein
MTHLQVYLLHVFKAEQELNMLKTNEDDMMQGKSRADDTIDITLNFYFVETTVVLPQHDEDERG